MKLKAHLEIIQHRMDSFGYESNQVEPSAPKVNENEETQSTTLHSYYNKGNSISRQVKKSFFSVKNILKINFDSGIPCLIHDFFYFEIHSPSLQILKAIL